MTTRDDEFAKTLGSLGITYLGSAALDPKPMALWKLIISVSSTPTEKFEDHEQLCAYWANLCSSLRLFEPSGRALLSLGGMAGDTWQHIQCEPASLVPASDGADSREPEFVIMNEEGSTMAAVTTEEYEYWVFVGRKLSGGWALLSHADVAERPIL